MLWPYDAFASALMSPAVERKEKVEHQQPAPLRWLCLPAAGEDVAAEPASMPNAKVQIANESASAGPPLPSPQQQPFAKNSALLSRSANALPLKEQGS